MTSFSGGSADAGHHVLQRLFPEPNPPGERALAAILLEEVERADLDFRRLVTRWTEVRNRSFECPEVPVSLERLADAGRPAVVATTTPGLGATLVTLPLAARLARQPRNLVAGVFHVGALIDPDPIGAFAAVALAVTVACLVNGRRDFVPDVLDVLLANGAPPALVTEVRLVPVPRRDPAVGLDPTPSVPAQVGVILRAIRYHWAAAAVSAGFQDQPAAVRRVGGALVGLRMDPGQQPTA